MPQLALLRVWVVIEAGEVGKGGSDGRGWRRKGFRYRSGG